MRRLEVEAKFDAVWVRPCCRGEQAVRGRHRCQRDDQPWDESKVMALSVDAHRELTGPMRGLHELVSHHPTAIGTI